MSTRFRKSFKVAPGVRVNVSKNSIGVSAGVKGAHVSVNSKGRFTKSVGIPGTGISNVETSTIGKGSSTKQAKKQAKAEKKAIENSQYLNPKNRPKKVGAKAKHKKLYLIGMIIFYLFMLISCEFESDAPIMISFFIALYCTLAFREAKWLAEEERLREQAKEQPQDTNTPEITIE